MSKVLHRSLEAKLAALNGKHLHREEDKITLMVSLLLCILVLCHLTHLTNHAFT